VRDTSSVVQLLNMTFRYRSRTVFSQLTLDIKQGITGLLGPNGAGKSTLMALIATQKAPDSGELIVLGQNSKSSHSRELIRSQIGFLPQRFPLVRSMSVIDTLAYAAWTNGIAKKDSYRAAERVSAKLELESLNSHRVGRLSGGQRQRVGLGCIMVHQPKLLILDEPTAGLDPEVRMGLRRVLKDAAKDCSILISTHLVDDVLAICDSIITLDKGRVLFQGTPEALADSAADVDGLIGLGSNLELGYEQLLRKNRGGQGSNLRQ